MSGSQATPAARRSFVELLAVTPLLDVVRGRLSGRLDWRGEIARSDLPIELRDVVTEVVRRTRLWRVEKAEVARELVAHFSDALEGETSADEARRAFGDTRTAAKLIRRGRRRMRGPVWKSWCVLWWVIGACAALMVLTYVVQFVRFHSGSPVIARNFAAELNADVAQIPEKNRAWPWYRQVMLGREELPMDEEGMPLEADLRVDSPRWPEMAAYLTRNAQWLALARDAAARPHMGYELVDQMDAELAAHLNKTTVFEAQPPSENPMVINLLLPHLGELRMLARLMRSDIRLAVEEGDSDRVMADLRAMMGIAHHSGGAPFLISGLVRLAVLALVQDTVRELLEEHREVLSDAQLTELAHLLSSKLTDGSISIDYASEKIMFEDVLQRLYTDDGNGDGRLTAAGLAIYGELDGGAGLGLESVVGPVVMSVSASRAEMREAYARIMDLAIQRAARPRWERDPDELSDAFEDLDRPISRQRYFLVWTLTPALSRVIQNVDMTTMRVESGLVMIALEMYRRKNGAFPATPESLVPAYLPRVPRDQFDGQAIRYARRGDSYVLYSIGADGDDDGGRISRGRTGSVARGDEPNVDGDMVLFPGLEESGPNG